MLRSWVVMSARGLRGREWTRRSWLLAVLPLPRLAAQKRRGWPPERYAYADPATEFLIERLTHPTHASLLPPPHARMFSRRGEFLIYASDRSGSFQLYRMNERTGESEQLTEARALEPDAFTLLTDDRSVCYFDGGALCRLSLRNLKARELYRPPRGWRREGGLSLSGDGKRLALTEARGDRRALRLIRTRNGDAATILERSGFIGQAVAGPRESQLLYLYEEELWLSGRRGQAGEKIPVPPGRILQAFWSADGRRIVYLHQPAEKGRTSSIREYDLTSRADTLVAPTSQFAAIGVNGDGSVFLGASANVASPYLLILVRVTRRELTLCEHGAREPAAVRPTFTPDSRRIYFQSDREGKPAIYRMSVERLVEPTDS